MADLSNIDLHDLAGHLEEALVHHGVNSMELARRSGVGQSTLSRILSGKQKHTKTSVLAKLLPFFLAKRRPS
ncbi:hypothetical protein NNJEOMEG_00037 [Fundidesulfovibrio magnetotacticus]|uniref:HTH cro/C1-type domain-containing protein n=1 Tax=Fundidesulfovibrio magnetotacticus TaxID=2730080 RepID=A0A6V8LVE3_9BACT|nr:helix-turn-helix transcriptional regulator [Fundidesulfovibrio magnetotacticus]GFK92215.1 hypothetical protein NNJEOMEG_00037 [Fundidesulfovibrio magnetotacticus]